MSSSASAANEELDDSLFEGMTLFNPSQIASTEPEPEPESDHRLPPTPGATLSSPSSSFAEPLDENLFSDLTLTPSDRTLEPPPSLNCSGPDPTILTGATLRQNSRKKRRPGMRIGYGRGGSGPFSGDRDHRSLPPSDGEEEDKNEVHSSDNTAVQAGSDSPKPSMGPGHVLVPDPDATPLAADEPESDAGGTASSTEIRFEQIRAQISEKLKRTRELTAKVSAKKKDCTRRKRRAAEDFIVASLKYREVEKELEGACEDEDFETAERLSESLLAAEKEKQALLNALRDSEAESDAIDVNSKEVLECQIAAEEECASLLKHFALDAANIADLVSEEAESVSLKEMDKWLSSTEALELKKMEVEVESHVVNGARLVLDDSIRQSVDGDLKEKDYLFKKKEMLIDELNKLLDLVKQKEDEIAENDFNIKDVEKRISNVTSGFQETQSGIDVKYGRLQSVLSEMELESEALLKKRNEIDDFISHERDRSAKLWELVKISEDEAKEYLEVVGLRRSLLLSISKSMEDKVRLVKAEEKLSVDVKRLRQEASEERASLKELSSTKSSHQQDIASSKQRIFFIDKRVPELEAEKKVAAAARNFKEAARIAAEAKILTVEKEDVLRKMEGTTCELGKLEEKIKNTIDRLQKTEGLISSKEKEVEITRFQRLCLVAGAALAERNAALDLGDVEEASLLLAEAEAAESEAKTLQVDCKFEEELANASKQFSMELVSNLGRKQLAELAASVDKSMC